MALSRRMERTGSRAGRSRHAGETLTEYAACLEGLRCAPPGAWTTLAKDVEAAAYGDADAAGRADAALHRWRSVIGRRRPPWGRRQPMGVEEADWRVPPGPRWPLGRRSR